MSDNKRLLRIKCHYCGYQEFKYFSPYDSLRAERCAHCGDDRLSIDDREDLRIDSYQGSPPFAAVDPEDDEDPFDIFNQ